MSESLNVLKTGRYEARGNDELATVSSEATRQREIWNLSNKAQRSLRETAGLNMNEPKSNVVIRTSSNGVNGRADPILLWRKQHHASTNPARMHGRSGVTGLACGEGYSREDGRDCIAPVKLTIHVELIKRPNVDSIHMHGSREVRMPISGSEVASHGMQPVRQVHSNDETPVMGADVKEPDFCERFPNSSWLSELPERKREGIVHEKQR